MWGAIFEAFSCYFYYFLSLASMCLSPSISTLREREGSVKEIQKETSLKPERIRNEIAPVGRVGVAIYPKMKFQRIFRERLQLYFSQLSAK